MYKATIFKVASFIFLITILASCQVSKHFVVRHAEKSTEPKNDPALTSEGQIRAENLAKLLENEGITKIYSTNTVRTKATGQPLATIKNIEIEIYDPKNNNVLVEKIHRAKYNSLIVGHSNTVKYLVNGISKSEYLLKDLDDSDYDFLFEIRKYKLRKPKVITRRF